MSDLRFPHIFSTNHAALVVFPDPGGPNSNRCCNVDGFFENIEKQVRTRSHQNDVSTDILSYLLSICLNPLFIFFLHSKYNHVSPDDVTLYGRALLYPDPRYPAFLASRSIVRR